MLADGTTAGDPLMQAIVQPTDCWPTRLISEMGPFPEITAPQHWHPVQLNQQT